MSINISSFIFSLFAVSISLRLGLSNSLVNSWYPYTDIGGMWLQKIHPSSILLITGAGLLAFFLGPLNVWNDQRRYQPEVAQFLLVLLFTAVINVFRFGTGGMAYLIDTFLVAAVYLMFALYLSLRHRHYIVLFIVSFVIVNSIVAIWERVFGTHLFFAPYNFGFFRASAFMGHPLANAIITATVAIAVLKMQWGWVTKVAVILILFLALLAFGARGATAAFLASMLVIIVKGLYSKKGDMGTRLGQIFGSYTILLMAAILAFFVIFHTGIGESISERISFDSSVQARLSPIELLHSFSLTEMLSGLQQDAFIAKTEAVGVTTVENFWVVLAIKLGLPLFLLLCVSLFFLVSRIIKDGDILDKAIVLVFFLTASTNNSLSSKSAALVVFLMLLYCLRGVRPYGLE